MLQRNRFDRKRIGFNSKRTVDARASRRAEDDGRHPSVALPDDSF
ncbi:MAG: hypothetical protein ABI277_13995 [Burkholderiaceae bacterium]